MLAENLGNWAKQELQAGRLEGRQLGRLEGRQEGEQLGIAKTARNLLKLGVLSNEQIAEATGLTVDEVARLRIENNH
tara:strand:- start:695 stop:925 length:231 start_codon:yes stop_codon:yes gene_type:complete